MSITKLQKKSCTYSKLFQQYIDHVTDESSSNGDLNTDEV